MSFALKDINRPLLVFVVMVNASIYLAVLHKGFSIDNWSETLIYIQEITPVLLVSIFTGIFNAQINDNDKARLVFWRWSHPLPGNRAFTEYAHKDARIDLEVLKKHQDPLPTEPGKQNSLWYKWCEECQSELRINQVHREYLFTRDYTGISFMFILTLGPLATWQMESIKFAGLYTIFLLAQYLFVRRAACTHGIQFVKSVLAYKSSNG